MGSILPTYYYGNGSRAAVDWEAAWSVHEDGRAAFGASPAAVMALAAMVMISGPPGSNLTWDAVIRWVIGVSSSDHGV
jgi:hypothetical protein